MKLAITADLHLTSKQKHPERFNAFENILKQLRSLNIDRLIIAGDLFDKNISNYSEFEKYFKKSEYSNIQVFIIPGNHDPQLKAKDFSIRNINIVEKPEIVSLYDSDKPFLFVPYKEGMTMGQIIADYNSQLENRAWILVGHGDYIGGIREPNPYEQGTYMPLSQKDLTRFRPQRTFLGHIHKSYSSGSLYYPGSPCPINIAETGRRHFLIYDIVNNELEPKRINSDIIYFDESITVLPVENEKEYMNERIREMLESLAINKDEKIKAVLRIRVRGYSRNKRDLKRLIENALKDYNIYGDNGVDVSNVNITEESAERIELMKQVQNYVDDEIDWSGKDLLPDKDEVMIKAMQTIFEA